MENGGDHYRRVVATEIGNLLQAMIQRLLVQNPRFDSKGFLADLNKALAVFIDNPEMSEILQLKDGAREGYEAFLRILEERTKEQK
ncbi:MAG: hypothetical protein HONBIEJF_02874 [Fimbriimonadaceae bacterium]|nr:hypothetical protein [Fimbriimonadaceae bacterium]